MSVCDVCWTTGPIVSEYVLRYADPPHNRIRLCEKHDASFRSHVYEGRLAGHVEPIASMNIYEAKKA